MIPFGFERGPISLESGAFVSLDLLCLFLGGVGAGVLAVVCFACTLAGGRHTATANLAGKAALLLAVAVAGFVLVANGEFGCYFLPFLLIPLPLVMLAVIRTGNTLREQKKVSKPYPPPLP